MDADIQIMVAGTVQTDCQVCDSVTLSFLTHGLCHLWQNSLWYVFPFALLPLNAERGAELLWGLALPQMGVNFHLAGGAKGASSGRTAKVKLVLPFSHSRQKFRRRPATRFE